MLANVLAAVALVPALLAAAHPTERGTPAELAPRTVQSGTTTCYWQCPGATTVTIDSGYTMDWLVGPSGGVCTYLLTYNGNSVNGECNYGVSTGTFESISGSGIAACPEQLSYECGTFASQQGFKRSYIPRQLTDKERLIQARQYKPRKVAPVAQN